MMSDFKYNKTGCKMPSKKKIRKYLEEEPQEEEEEKLK